MAVMLVKGVLVEKRGLQIYDISRDDFEKTAQSLEGDEVMRRVIVLPHGLGDTRVKVIRLDPDTLALSIGAIRAAAQQIGLRVIAKTPSDGIAIALETDEDRAR